MAPHRPAGWTSRVEDFVVERIRNEPRVRLVVLRREVAETFGFNVETMDSFARLLSDVVYRRHPDVAALRGAGTGARDARTTRLEALRTALEEAARSERFESEVVAFLDARERLLVTELSAGTRHAALLPAVKSTWSTPQARSRAMRRLLTRLQRWLGGGPFEVAQSEAVAKRIAAAVYEQTSDGVALESLFDACGLNETERSVVTQFALARARTPLLRIAHSIGRQLITVVAALRSAANKLDGNEARHHLKQKYFAMKDADLMAAIHTNGAPTRQLLHRSNPPLAGVANARGVLDHVFPPPAPKDLVLLRHAVRGLLSRRSLAELCDPLSAVECGVITQRVLRDRPEGLEYFRRGYGVRNVGELQSVERRLVAKLTQRQYKGRVLDSIRRIVETLGEDGLTAALPMLNAHERDVVVERARNPSPVTLATLASRWTLSRERARQIEERLLLKLIELARTYATGGAEAIRAQLSDSTVGHARVLRKIRTIVAGLPAPQLVTFMQTLSPVERNVFERRAAADDPVTMTEVAATSRRSFTRLMQTEKRLLDRLQTFGSRADEPSHGFMIGRVQNLGVLSEIRAQLNAFSPEQFAEFAATLPPVERVLLERRASVIAPARLDVLAAELARTLPGLTAAEKRLLTRVAAYVRGRITDARS